MGTIIEFNKFQQMDQGFRLVIYACSLLELQEKSFSANKSIAEELITIKPKMRTMRLEQVVTKYVFGLPEEPFIKDFDVLFHPSYEVDVLKVLISTYRKKPFCLLWPGTYADGKLIYSEAGFPDYKVYDIKDYDIVCVI